MRILIYGLNHSPELTGIGKYNGEMASWLSKKGHDVRVVCAPPYYPAWKVAPGYSRFGFTKEVIEGCLVIRCPLWVPSQPGGLKRILHLASFAISSFFALIGNFLWRPEVVFVVEPPLFCAPNAILFSKCVGAKSWLHIQDYEVDAAFDLGVLKGQKIRAFVSSVERSLMRGFDRVTTISGRMLDRALAKGVDKSNVGLFPNWVDVSHITPLHAPSPFRQELGLPSDAIVSLYSGNMGGKQGLEILGELAARLKDDPRLHFVFCGDGAGKADLVARCKDLANVYFMSLQPIERLNDLLGLADIHLLPQRADAADLVMPSKLTGMLASGRPVVATAHQHTELARIVAGCGLVVPPEDPASLAAAVLALADTPERSKAFGIAARKYAEAELNVHSVLSRFEVELAALVAG